jgi:hypothetical protein
VIHDDDLHALADVPVTSSAGGGAGCRPVADVLARGNHLRRRRQVVRAAGVTAVVGTVAATGTLVLTRGDPDPNDIRTVQETPPTAAAEAPTLYADPFACQGSEEPDDPGLDVVEPTPIPNGEVPDAARVLPTWTPGDMPVTSAFGSVYLMSEGPDACVVPIAEMQETLTLKGTSADGTVTGTISLEGPYSQLAEAGIMGVGVTPTQVRGQDANVVDPTFGDDTTLEWTEPDGGAYRLWATGADEATVRAVAEALQLDSSPAPGVPPAQLAPEDVPAGYDIVEQAATVPGPAQPLADETTWTVVVGTESAQQTGILCHLDVRTSGDEATELPSGVGSEQVTVDGRTGVWSPFGGLGGPDAERWRQLTWDLAPGVRATAECTHWDGSGGRTLPLEDVVRFAESVEPVAADDPRIPGRPDEPTG